MTAPTRFGTEFGVNTTTSGNQDGSAVASLAGGGFVVVWQDRSGSTSDVRAQIYNADGTPRGGEIAVATGAGDQQNPVVTATADGRFVVAWEDQRSTLSIIASSIRAHVYNADGSSPASGNYADTFLVSTLNGPSGTHINPAIAAAANGRFMVTWQYDDGDIHARSFNAAGPFEANEFAITSTDHMVEPSIAGLADGTYLVSWTDAPAGSVFAQIFPGNAGAAAPPEGPTVDLTTGLGGFFDEVSVSARPGGGFIAAMRNHPNPADIQVGDQVFVRYFLSDGTPDSTRPIYSLGNGDDEHAPAVAALPGGFYAAVWTDPTGDGAGGSVQGTLGEPTNAIADGFLANAAVTAGDQIAPSIAALPDGRFVVTWTDPGLDPAQPDSSGSSVRAQVFDPRTAAVSLVGTALGEDWVGTGFADTLLGQSGADRLDGAAGDDTLGGGDDGDTLLGGAGNDWLFGNAGADSMEGGAGNDSYTADDSADRAVEQPGAGTDTVQSSASFALGANVERLFLTGAAAINGTGNAGANQVNGNTANNILSGLDGDDTLAGAAGGDTLNGGSGADRLTGGTQRDKLIPGADSAADTLVFKVLNDSTGVTRDVISGIDFNAEDRIDLPGTVSAVRAQITGGALSTATFNADLAAAVTAAKLGAGQAVLFDPTSGNQNLAGTLYLIVDANGLAGYQANADWVFQLESPTGTLDPTDFI